MKEYKGVNSRLSKNPHDELYYITQLDYLFSKYAQNIDIDGLNKLVLKIIKQGGVAIKYNNNQYIPESIKAEYNSYGEYFTKELLSAIVKGNFSSSEPIACFSLRNLDDKVKNLFDLENPKQAKDLIDNCVINFNKMEKELCHIEKRITLNCFKKHFYRALDLIGKKNFPEIYQDTKLAKNLAIIKKIQDIYLNDITIANLNEIASKSSKDFPILNLPIILIILNIFKDMSLSKFNEYFLKLSKKFNDNGKEFHLKDELAQFTNIFPKFTKNILNDRIEDLPDEYTKSVLYSFLQRLCSKDSELNSNLIHTYFNKLDPAIITNLVEIYYHNRVFYGTRHTSEKPIFNSGLFKTLPNEIKSHIAHFVIENFVKSFVDSCAKNQQIDNLYTIYFDASDNMSDSNNFKHFSNIIKNIENNFYYTSNPSTSVFKVLGDIDSIN